MKTETRDKLEVSLREAVVEALRILEPCSIGVLCRKPLLDEDCPEVSDVDLLSIWGRSEEYPERMMVTTSLGRVFVDVLWIPIAALFDPVEAASFRMLPHLLLESEEILMQSRPAAILINQIRHKAHKKGVWERRIGSYFNFGDAALQEAQRNLDFSPASIFYLQAAHSYYITALADCIQQSVMSLMTRPMTKLRKMTTGTNSGLEERITTNLHLKVDPSPSLIALKKLYDVVKAGCAVQRLQSVNSTTRGHYAYSISPLELEYRIAVAQDLIRRGDRANANFYLRFWAYSLSRCPIVLNEIKNDKNPSFYVPNEPLKKSLLTACPEIIDDLALILGGEISEASAKESIRGTITFRRSVTDLIEGTGLRPVRSEEGFGEVDGVV